MLEFYLRPAYQYWIVNPVAKPLKTLAAEKITYLACLTGILAATLLVLHYSLIATILILVSGFLDTLDGTIARMQNGISNKGSVLDIMSDRIVELALLIALFALDPTNRAWCTLAMLGSCYLCITSFLVVGIFTENVSEKSFQYSPGLIERAEAFLFFISMIWLPEYFVYLAWLFSMLVIITSYLRIAQFMRLESRVEMRLVIRK